MVACFECVTPLGNGQTCNPTSTCALNGKCAAGLTCVRTGDGIGTCTDVGQPLLAACNPAASQCETGTFCRDNRICARDELPRCANPVPLGGTCDSNFTAPKCSPCEPGTTCVDGGVLGHVCMRPCESKGDCPCGLTELCAVSPASPELTFCAELVGVGTSCDLYHRCGQGSCKVSAAGSRTCCENVGASCTTASDCCASTDGTIGCISDGGPLHCGFCKSKDDACSSPADCCGAPGLTCRAGRCEPTECTTEGSTCSIDAQCCAGDACRPTDVVFQTGGYGDPGTPVDAQCCRNLESSCALDADCCPIVATTACDFVQFTGYCTLGIVHVMSCKDGSCMSPTAGSAEDPLPSLTGMCDRCDNPDAGCEHCGLGTIPPGGFGCSTDCDCIGQYGCVNPTHAQGMGTCLCGGSAADAMAGKANEVFGQNGRGATCNPSSAAQFGGPCCEGRVCVADPLTGGQCAGSDEAPAGLCKLVPNGLAILSEGSPCGDALVDYTWTSIGAALACKPPLQCGPSGVCEP